MAGVNEAPVAFSEDLDLDENPEESGDKVKRVRHNINLFQRMSRVVPVAAASLSAMAPSTPLLSR